MTRFTELLQTGEVHSAYENVTTTTSVSDTAPASVEEPVNPPPLDFDSMSKLELETFGRTIGIELIVDIVKKLIKELERTYCIWRQNKPVIKVAHKGFHQPLFLTIIIL